MRLARSIRLCEMLTLGDSGRTRRDEMSSGDRVRNRNRMEWNGE